MTVGYELPRRVGSAAAAGSSAASVTVGVTNIDAASYGDDIATAIAALPSGGGRVWLNKASYVLSAGISTSKANLELVGAGGTGMDSNVGNGATQIVVPAGAVGFDWNHAGVGEIYQAPTLRRLHFRDATPGSGVGGVRIGGYGRAALIEDVTVSEFTAGFGIQLDQGGSTSQYACLREPVISRCKNGIVANSNGTEIFGGYLDAQGNSAAAVVVGSKGVTFGFDSCRAFGTRVQYYETAFDVGGGTEHELHGVRVEGFTTAAHFAGTTSQCQVHGGAFDNSVLGSVGTVFVVDAGATGVKLVYPVFANVGTFMTNNGTGTVWALGVPRIQALTNAASVAIAIDKFDGGSLAALSQDSTIANPTAGPTPYDGQRYALRILSAAVRALTWGTIYRGSTDVPLPAATTGASKEDLMGFQYNATDSKWDLVGCLRGF